LGGEVAERTLDLDFALMVGQRDRLGEHRRFGNVTKQLFDGVNTDGVQHPTAIFVGER
jgi:hypothetical protein